MITIKSNASGVIASVIAKVRKLGSTEQLMRTIAQDLAPIVKKRIHTHGIAADGEPIGTYSSGYMKLRTKGYKSDNVTRGPRKGDARPIKKFNRTSDTKIVASLTRQMELDWSVIQNGRGYGLGYKNEENFKKVGWVESSTGKKIFALTDSERKQAIETAKAFRDQTLNG